MIANELYWIWLTDKTHSKVEINRLLDKFENIEGIYRATTQELKLAVEKKTAEALSDKSLARAEKIWGEAAKIGAFVVTIDSEYYPPLLKQIYDPPYVLYMKGNLFDWNSFISIGVVGTRKCSDYGRKITEYFARELSKNDIMVVSGLALGVDAVAAKGAFSEGKPSIAVLGCGIDMVYPMENENLYECVENTGLIISEYAPGAGIPRGSFPRRNRIISGISHGVLVTQAPIRSGALITAKFALEQGRDVFAAPANIDDPGFYGSNKLFGDSAIPAMSVYDILKEYPGYADKKPEVLRYYKENQTPFSGVGTDEKPPKKEDVIIEDGLSDMQKSILKCISLGHTHVDEIARETCISNSLVSNELLLIELMGHVKSNPGNRYELKGKLAW